MTGWIEVAFQCPGHHFLSALLDDLTYLERFSRRQHPDLFRELAQCSLAEVLPFFDHAFRNAPRALIPLSPKWSAHVAKKHFKP